MYIIVQITLTARIATDNEPFDDLEAALKVVTDLNRDAIQEGFDERWIVDLAA